MANINGSNDPVTSELPVMTIGICQADNSSGDTTILEPEVFTSTDEVEESPVPFEVVDAEAAVNQDTKTNTSQNGTNMSVMTNETKDDTIEKSRLLHKAKRRVYFPEDGAVVAGYMDPPKPLNDPSSCSTTDLVNAYTQACEKHKAKVIPSLLKQLHAISDFSVRNETLTLKGEKLDYRHCETLEEILRRVQFQTIDLEATHLEADGANALFDMLEYYQSATRFNISYNRSIGPRGWHSFSRMLKRTPCLKQVDIRGCGLTEQVMPMLGHSLRMGAALTTLHFENSALSGKPLMILVAALKMNEILRELFLAENRLMPTDGIQLGSLLKYNHHLRLLDVRTNHLQDTGTAHICEGIAEQKSNMGLTTLVLWNNQLSYQSMPAIVTALVLTSHLETVNLGHNSITNRGVFCLKGGLLQNRSLLRLGLQAAKLSCEGAVALAEFIADSPRLLRLDLRENSIKTAGLMALALSLKVNKTVTKLDLDREPKREARVKDYMEQQQHQLDEINRCLQNNLDLIRLREEATKLQLSAVELPSSATTTTTGNASSDELQRKKDSLSLDLPLQPEQQTAQLTLESPALTSDDPEVFDTPVSSTEDAVISTAGQVTPSEEPPPKSTAKVPLSPMVLMNGATVLAPVAVLPSVEEEQQDGNEQVEETTQVRQTTEASSAPASKVQLDVLVDRSPSPNRSPNRSPSRSPNRSPYSSPSMRRKFIISKVEEQQACPADQVDASTMTKTNSDDKQAVSKPSDGEVNVQCAPSGSGDVNCTEKQQLAEATSVFSLSCSTVVPADKTNVEIVAKTDVCTTVVENSAVDFVEDHDTKCVSTLSLNGIRTELADALQKHDDDDDAGVVSHEDVSLLEADDFEKELDVMLATVKGDNNNPLEGLSIEEILAEAADELE